MQKQRGSICLLDGSYFLWDVQIGAHVMSIYHLLAVLWSLATLLLQKPHLFKHHFSSSQRPKKIKVSYLGEIKLNNWSIFSHSVTIWIKVLGYLACRSWTSWKVQIPMGFCEKSLLFPHREEVAINWDLKHTTFKDFSSILLYFFTYDGETIFIKPARDTLKFLIHVFFSLLKQVWSVIKRKYAKEIFSADIWFLSFCLYKIMLLY